MTALEIWEKADSMMPNEFAKWYDDNVRLPEMKVKSILLDICFSQTDEIEKLNSDKARLVWFIKKECDEDSDLIIRFRFKEQAEQLLTEMEQK